MIDEIERLYTVALIARDESTKKVSVIALNTECDSLEEADDLLDQFASMNSSNTVLCVIAYENDTREIVLSYAVNFENFISDSVLVITDDELISLQLSLSENIKQS